MLWVVNTIQGLTSFSHPGLFPILFPFPSNLITSGWSLCEEEELFWDVIKCIHNGIG